MPISEVTYSGKSVCVPNEGGQQKFAGDWDHFIVALEGGWYSGKTWVGARKLITGHQINAFDENGEPTYIPSLVIAPTYGNAMDFCVPELQTALDEIGVSWKFKNSGYLGQGTYAAPGMELLPFGTAAKPSCILVRSADVPRRIAGFTVGLAWGDEPARWREDRFDPLNDPYIQMLGRVRAKKAKILQIYLTYTNEGDVTRVYEEMHDGNPNKALYRAPTSQNPTARKFRDMQTTLLTEQLAEQYLDGKAMPLRGGKVYTSFDFNTNVDSKITLRRNIPLQISLDFNIVPGMHMIVGQYHADFDLFTAIYEIHAPRMDVRVCAETFVKLISELEWNFSNDNPLEIYGDSTGQNEWAGTGQSCYSILQAVLKNQDIEYRTRIPDNNPPVIDRINAVNCALFDLSGAIHYKIHPRCGRLVTDYRKLVRDRFGEIDKTDRKLSHPSDAEGYRISYIRPVRVKTDAVSGRFSVT
jgi:hypothetical protein